MRDKDDDIEGNDYAFYISKVVGGSLQSPARLPIASTSVTGNFSPVAIDTVTGYFYMVYFEGAFGSVSDTHMVIFDPVSLNYTEITLPQNLGVPYGHDSLWVNNGEISFVTASNWSEIRINRWTTDPANITWTGMAASAP